MFTFQSCKFLNDKIDQNINFAKCQIVYFGITVNFIIQKLKFCKIEEEEDRSCDSTAKRNLSKDM